MNTETATPEAAHKLDALAPYNEVRAALAELKAKNAAMTFDYASTKGASAARSHIYTLRKRNADVERVRKATKAEALEFGKKVDAVAKELSGEIEAMIAVHEKPLLEIEERETARINKHQQALADLVLVPGVELPRNSIACRNLLSRIAGTLIDKSWDEFEQQARDAQGASIRVLEARLAELTKSEAEAEELKKLREIQAKRDAEDRARAAEEEQRKRDEAIRAAAEAKAKREAEEAAEAARRKEAEAAMAEARRKEAEAQAAINAEREKTRQAELAVARAKQEKADAEAKAAREEQERKRQEQERQEAEARRQADKAHRARVMAEAEHAIAAAGSAAAIVDAIAAGKIPHVSIKF